MKVLAAHFTAECNEHISHTVDIEEFLVLYGKECIDNMHVRDIFEEEEIELIPSIYANLHPNGMIKRQAFDFIKNKIFDTINDHKHEIDGIYLQLHGASGVLDLPEVSGEHYILKGIRKIVGRQLPIALVMDPHGNITNEIAQYTNLVRCYRESPHSDQIETERLVAKKFIHLLKHRRPMAPIILKLPIMVGGERSVSAHEPMKTINQMLDNAEKDPRVFSASYHVGYIRHDDDKLGAAVTVVPNERKDNAYCKKIAEEISAYAWAHRREFKFSGNYAAPDQAINIVLKQGIKTTVITDSGDNCGAGGYGQNTIMLREVLKKDLGRRKTLFAGITDVKTHAQLEQVKIGDKVHIELGTGENDNSLPVPLDVELKGAGEEMYGLGVTHTVGKCYIVSIINTNIDIIVLDRNIQYGNMKQFQAAGLDFHDYDIVIVKMGYLDTHLIPETAYHMMALTDGPTIQQSEKIPFKRIARPMWPIDEVDELYYIE